MLIVPMLWTSYRPYAAHSATLNIASSSNRERFRLFTIIVVGETIVGVVAGLSLLHHPDLTVGVLGALGLIFAFEIWWIYFDYSANHRIKGTGLEWIYAYMFVHLPIWIGIIAVGPSVLNVVAAGGEAIPAEERLSG